VHPPIWRADGWFSRRSGERATSLMPYRLLAARLSVHALIAFALRIAAAAIAGVALRHQALWGAVPTGVGRKASATLLTTVGYDISQ